MWTVSGRCVLCQLTRVDVELAEMIEEAQDA
jgi:hypothetical protein